MSKDKITVNMNVHDIPIVVEALEKANKEIERLQKENKKLKLCLGIISPSRVLLEGKYWEKDDNEEIERLNNIINELEDRIDKTIALVNNKEYSFITIGDYIYDKKQELLNVLQGEDKK